MGYPIMILGESGSGKSASLRFFSPNDIGIINVSNKPLPFKNAEMTKRCTATDDMRTVIHFLQKAKARTIIIDDAQYLMANQYMRTSSQTGFQKFVDVQKAFWDIIQTVNMQMPPDKLVYFLMHVETDGTGKEKAKTIGKMLDEKITLEGLFTMVLKTMVVDGQYYFSTQNSGNDTVKSPMGMFDEPLIANDLQYVDTVFRAYYDLPGIAL